MNPPNPQWPGKAKVCVSFVVQYYMGAVSMGLDIRSTSIDKCRNPTYLMEMIPFARNSSKFPNRPLRTRGTRAASQCTSLEPDRVYLDYCIYFKSEAPMYLTADPHRHDVPVTWNICKWSHQSPSRRRTDQSVTRAIEKDPFWIKPIIKSGAEVSCGGYRYKDLLYTDPEQEDKWIEKSLDLFDKLVGQPPQGSSWVSSGKLIV